MTTTVKALRDFAGGCYCLPICGYHGWVHLYFHLDGLLQSRANGGNQTVVSSIGKDRDEGLP